MTTLNEVAAHETFRDLALQALFLRIVEQLMRFSGVRVMQQVEAVSSPEPRATSVT